MTAFAEEEKEEEEEEEDGGEYSEYYKSETPALPEGCVIKDEKLVCNKGVEELVSDAKSEAEE